MQFYKLQIHLKTLFKKPLVFAIFYRLGTDHSLSCYIVFTFVESKKKTMENLKFNSLYIFLAYSVANLYSTIG